MEAECVELKLSGRVAPIPRAIVVYTLHKKPAMGSFGQVLRIPDVTPEGEDSDRHLEFRKPLQGYPDRCQPGFRTYLWRERDYNFGGFATAADPVGGAHVGCRGCTRGT